MIKTSGVKSMERAMLNDDIKSRREKILERVKEGVAQALERHRRLGQSIAVWQDGKVVILKADKIPAQSEQLQPHRSVIDLPESL
jgi:uncharacterized protein YacL (UPF0231 family)